MICKRGIFLAVQLVLLAVFGCTRSSEPAKSPQRILSLSGAATHILTELGAPPAAIDEYGEIAAGDTPPPSIGKGAAVSREKMAELGIDCVVLWHYQEEAADRFRQGGLRVETIPPPRLANYPTLILHLGYLTGKTREAQLLAGRFTRELDALPLPAGPPVRAYFELYSPGRAAGDESYLGDLLRAAGIRSVVARTGVVGGESVIDAAPDVIYYIEGFGNAEEIAARPGFATLPAVRNSRIFPVPRRLVVEGLAPLEAIAFFNRTLRR